MNDAKSEVVPNTRQESILQLVQLLSASEQERLHGKSGYSIDEVAALMMVAVEGTGK